ncbi:hypothetical protein H9Q09_12025 [Aurantimonas sp. DM33-3]|uniref:hypothetical protein n=1 Tax=Aurantimonas sp. DM33-3 TaxID=2766955 RepID=UPI001652873E|nr:hypothetical protein [Aurantimonas sp. DM33-3]MBC6716936.1 hypothetical protein [Aurantimonas sp. DM33-3]
MGKIGSFLKAIMRALRATVLVPVAVAGGVEWIWRSVFGGPAPEFDTEIVEVPDAKEAMAVSSLTDDQRDRERSARQTAIAHAALTRLVKQACDLIDDGQELDDAFFDETHDSSWILPWVRSLTDGDRRTIRHMPEATLLGHLSGHRELQCLPSYQNIDLVAAQERIEAMREAERTKDWTTWDHYCELVDEAVERDDIHLIDRRALWVEAQRRAGVPEDEIDDYGI